MGNKYDTINLFLETCHYDVWFEKEDSTNTTSRNSDKDKSMDSYDMPPLKGEREKISKNLDSKKIVK